MTSEQLISTAKEKLGTTSASDRTIENFFSNPSFCPAEGVEPDDAYWERTTAVFKWFSDNYDGQHNHAMSTAHSAWEEQWKKEHPAVNQEPKQHEQKKEEQSNTGVTADDVARIVAEALAKNNKKDEPSAELIELQKQMKAMQDEKVAAETKVKVDSIYSTVKAKILESGAELVDLEDAIEYVQMKGSIGKDTSLDVAEKMIRDRYERQYQRHNPGGTAPYGITSTAANGGKSYAQQWAERNNAAKVEQLKTVEAQRNRFK